MDIAINLALIIVSIAVIAAVLLQAKGGGFGNTFGAGESLYGSRRGVERTLFQITVALMIIFILLDLFAVLYLYR